MNTGKHTSPSGNLDNSPSKSVRAARALDVATAFPRVSHFGARPALCLAAAIAAVGLLLPGLVSCTQTRNDREQHLANTGEPALHAVFGEDLRREMAELDRLTAGELRETIYTGTEPQRDLREVAEVAAFMARTAERLPQALDSTKITEEDRPVFLKLAEKLRTESLELNRQARDNDYEGAKAATERVTATCNACHTAFRLTPIERG